MIQTRPLDTTVDAEQAQLEVLRKMSPSERLRRACSLTESVRRLLAQGVRTRHPDYSEEQIRLAVIRLILPDHLFAVAYPHAVNIVP